MTVLPWLEIFFIWQGTDTDIWIEAVNGIWTSTFDNEVGSRRRNDLLNIKGIKNVIFMCLFKSSRSTWRLGDLVGWEPGTSNSKGRQESGYRNKRHQECK